MSKGDSPPEPEDNLSPNDPEDSNQQRRLGDISDSRRRVKELLEQLELAHELEEREANTVLRRSVENYILDLEWLLTSEETDGREYWGYTVSSTDNQGRERTVEKGIRLGTMALPDGTATEFIGLRSILNAPDPITVSWVEKDRNPITGITVTEEEDSVQISREVLLNAYRTCNRFAGECGLGVELEGQKPHSEI